MASTVKIIGDNTIIWGSDGAYSGIVISASKKLTGEKVEILDNNGNTVAVVYFDDKNQCTVEIIVQAAAPELERGDSVTLCGIPCLVDDAEEKWAQKDCRKYSVNATRYLAMTL